jgi:hypothetical protein
VTRDDEVREHVFDRVTRCEESDRRRVGDIVEPKYQLRDSLASRVDGVDEAATVSKDAHEYPAYVRFEKVRTHLIATVFQVITLNFTVERR